MSCCFFTLKRMPAGSIQTDSHTHAHSIQQAMVLAVRVQSNRASRMLQADKLLSNVSIEASRWTFARGSSMYTTLAYALRTHIAHNVGTHRWLAGPLPLIHTYSTHTDTAADPFVVDSPLCLSQTILHSSSSGGGSIKCATEYCY